MPLQQEVRADCEKQGLAVMWILVESGPERGRILVLPAGPSVIGSGAGADIRISGRTIAPRHARLEPLVDGTVRVEALDSPEATFIDGDPVLRPAMVGPGVPVRLGGTVFVLLPGPGHPATDPHAPTEPALGAPTASATPFAAPTQEERRRWWAIGGVAAMALMAVFLLLQVLAIAGPQGAAVSLVVAVLPAPVLVSIVLLIDRYEPEPPHMLGLTFLWGATAAVLLAGILNALGGGLAQAAFGPGLGGVFTMVVIAPVVEETLKAGAVLFVFWRWREEFNGVIDGLVYSAMVGLGFEATENMLYYAQAILEGQDTFVITIVARAGLSPFAHPLFTSMVGIGLALYVEGGRGGPLLPLAGLLAAIGLHMLWNGAAAAGLVFFLVYVFVIIPSLITVVLVARRAVRREESLLRTYLRQDVATGLLTVQEVEKLASVRLRRRAERESARVGRRARDLRRQFHHAATELAFLRHRQRTMKAPQASTEDDEAHWVAEVRRLKTLAKGPEAFMPDAEG